MVRAVAAIHSAGIIHRDLKPANFVVTKNGVVKLLDLGLGKMLSRRRCQSRKQPKLPETVVGTILGTVGYMSPEQVRGEEADKRSDVFSVGTLFYEMLTGRRAFQKKTPIETMCAILYQTAAELPVRIPGALADIVRHCLEKNPISRYKTANELFTDLSAIIDT
jgi:serine/threonine protein kinase